MSFLIENILRDDFGSEHVNNNKETSEINVNKNRVQRSVSMNDSILHQTLMRKNYSNCRIPECMELYPSLNYFDRKMSYSSPGYINTAGIFPPLYEDLFFSFSKNCSMSLAYNQFKQYKRKGGQIRFTTNQTDVLEKTFVSHKYLTPEERKLLADNLKLSDRQVKTWFQNRRAKWRRSISSTSGEDQKECDSQME